MRQNYEGTPVFVVNIPYFALSASSGKSGLKRQNKIFQSGRNVLLLNNFKRKAVVVAVEH